MRFKRAAKVATSPKWSLFWAAWAIGFAWFDFAYLSGGWRAFGYLMVVLAGFNLFLAGMYTFSPRWRRTREWLDEQ